MRRALRDIPQLVEELREEKKHNRDIVVPSRGIQMFSGEEGLCLQVKNKDMEASFTMQKQVHTMLAPRLGIPSKYYSKMREEAPALLCKNANWWFDVHGDEGKQRLIRIHRDSVRAVLFQFFGYSIVKYRTFNLFAFYLLSILVFLLLKKLTKDKNLSLFTAVLFCVHAINTTLIQYTWNLDIILSTICLILSSLTVLKYLKQPKWQLCIIGIILTL